MDEIIRERRAEQHFAQLKESRDNAAVERALDHLTRAAVCSENRFYPMKGSVGEASESYAGSSASTDRNGPWAREV